jgi:hypothetical protein
MFKEQPDIDCAQHSALDNIRKLMDQFLKKHPEALRMFISSTNL